MFHAAFFSLSPLDIDLHFHDDDTFPNITFLSVNISRLFELLLNIPHIFCEILGHLNDSLEKQKQNGAGIKLVL